MVRQKSGLSRKEQHRLFLLDVWQPSKVFRRGYKTRKDGRNPGDYLTEIECTYKVHNTLGFGFLESVYQNALLIELIKADLQAEKEKKIQVHYHNQLVGDYIADIIVEDKVIFELKSVKELHPAHSAQLINYLKATSLEIGLLINFGESVEIKRKVLTPPKDCS